MRNPFSLDDFAFVSHSFCCSLLTTKKDHSGAGGKIKKKGEVLSVKVSKTGFYDQLPMTSYRCDKYLIKFHNFLKNNLCTIIYENAYTERKNI